MFDVMIRLIYDVFFLKGEEGYRLTPLPLKVLFLALLLLINIKTYSAHLLLVLFLVLLIFSFNWPGPRWTLSATLLSSIPAIWYAISTSLSTMIGLTESHMPLSLVFIKTLLYSLGIMLFLVSVSPIEIAQMLYYIHRAYAYVPILTWYIVPHIFSQFRLSLWIGKLKRESKISRIPSSFAVSMEISEEIEKNTLLKRSLIPKTKLKIEYSARESAILLLEIIIFACIYYLSV